MALRLKVVKPENMAAYEDYVLVHRKGEKHSEPAVLEVFFRSRDGEYDEAAKTTGWWESVPIVRPPT